MLFRSRRYDIDFVRRNDAWWLAGFTLLLSSAGCRFDLEGKDRCASDADCVAGRSCVEHACVASPGAGDSMSAADASDASALADAVEEPAIDGARDVSFVPDSEASIPGVVIGDSNDAEMPNPLSRDASADVAAERARDADAPPAVGPEGPSCDGLAARCGQPGDSCCKSLLIPSGVFVLGGRQYPISPASVSNYYLDKYEVTVGRFAKFVAAYDEWRAAGNPAPGSGAHPRIAKSGWQARWNDQLEKSSRELKDNVQLSCPNYTWGAGDTLPMNCVTWYDAFAFCSWDGGRLPTEAEWEYATGGGNEERPYAWGSSPVSQILAVYGCSGIDAAPTDCTVDDIPPAGSRPLGAGKWHQLDLNGSVYEWVLDLFAPYPSRCDDCANVSGTGWRIMRGGGWRDDAGYLSAVRRDYVVEASGSETTQLSRFEAVGMRCAKDLPPRD